MKKYFHNGELDIRKCLEALSNEKLLLLDKEYMNDIENTSKDSLLYRVNVDGEWKILIEDTLKIVYFDEIYYVAKQIYDFKGSLLNGKEVFYKEFSNHVKLKEKIPLHDFETIVQTLSKEKNLKNPKIEPNLVNLLCIINDLNKLTTKESSGFEKIKIKCQKLNENTINLEDTILEDMELIEEIGMLIKQDINEYINYIKILNTSNKVNVNKLYKHCNEILKKYIETLPSEFHHFIWLQISEISYSFDGIIWDYKIILPIIDTSGEFYEFVNERINRLNSLGYSSPNQLAAGFLVNKFKQTCLNYNDKIKRDIRVALKNYLSSLIAIANTDNAKNKIMEEIKLLEQA